MMPKMAVSRKTGEAPCNLIFADRQNADSRFRYARIVRSHLSDVEDAADWLPKVTIPTLVLTCCGDIISHPEGSTAAARPVPGSALHVHDRGDHFLFYADSCGDAPRSQPPVRPA